MATSGTKTYFNGTISPLLISATAAILTLKEAGKSRSSICRACQPDIQSNGFDGLTYLRPHPSGPLWSAGNIWELFPARKLRYNRIKWYRHGGHVEDIGDLGQLFLCCRRTVRHVGVIMIALTSDPISRDCKSHVRRPRHFASIRSIGDGT